MTESTVVFTKETNSAAAGADLGARLREGLGDHEPDAVIVFASSEPTNGGTPHRRDDAA